MEGTLRRFEGLKMELALPANNALTSFVSHSYTVQKREDHDLKAFISATPEVPPLKERLLTCLDVYTGLLVSILTTWLISVSNQRTYSCKTSSSPSGTLGP